MRCSCFGMLRLIHMLKSVTIYDLLLCLHHILSSLQKTHLSSAMLLEIAS